MSLLARCCLFAASTLFVLRVLRWGGADRLEGWKSHLFLDNGFGSSCSAEQIRLYFPLPWLVGAAWFVIGPFVPGARGHG
ncbi:hypothetical protein [Stenotrophomonas sp. MMGLT7]|uniref:hypothetical protein n=1 Tax=Stenotrophomonas sp. MMGLT7 TaxID=2901227 RepID=UPI001E3B8114|nr:hypothetical protein [Stenotrophomonas sp. MMGLT7]MCD7099954.1 hypothetical protein [Stenotrophomonas sp. MMGLT7]